MFPEAFFTTIKTLIEVLDEQRVDLYAVLLASISLAINLVLYTSVMIAYFFAYII